MTQDEKIKESIVEKWIWNANWNFKIEINAANCGLNWGLCIIIMDLNLSILLVLRNLLTFAKNLEQSYWSDDDANVVLNNSLWFEITQK